MATGAPLNPANPGGDVQTDAMKTIFVFRASDGALIGRWVLPREQSRTENCTIHNYAFGPFVDRHIIVQGSYQSGSSVIDFTNPANAQEIAWVDPPSLSTTQLILGGAWSTHWYNDFVYESDIPRGVAVYDVAEPWWETHSIELPFLNLQTMTDTLRCTVRATGRLQPRRAARLNVTVRVNAQAVAGVDVTLRGPGVRRSLETNPAGRATAAVKPRRRGTLRVTANAQHHGAVLDEQADCCRPAAGPAGPELDRATGLADNLREADRARLPSGSAGPVCWMRSG